MVNFCIGYHFCLCFIVIALANVSVLQETGLLIDNNLKFSYHAEAIVSEAHQHVSLVVWCFKCMELDPALLYKAFVNACETYWVQIWTPTYLYLVKKIERVHKRFTKWLHSFIVLPYHESLHRVLSCTASAKIDYCSLQYRCQGVIVWCHGSQCHSWLIRVTDIIIFSDNASGHVIKCEVNDVTSNTSWKLGSKFCVLSRCFC